MDGVTTLPHPTGPRWGTPSTDPAYLVAQFRAMTRRQRREVEVLAQQFYALRDQATIRWAEAAQLHPSFETIATVVWDEMPRYWRGSAICQLITDALCGPPSGLPPLGWHLASGAIGYIRETNL